MVQFPFFGEFKTGATKLADLLAPSLGQGLGSMFSSYQANKALESALNDPKLKSATIDEKLSALETKMRPFGEIGEQLFNRRFKLEELGQQEKLKQQTKLADKENYEIVKNNFGKDIADLWSVSDQGAKTELVKNALEFKRRGLDISKLFQKEIISEEAPAKIPKDDYSFNFSGLLPKEKLDQKNTLRKENLPIFQEAQKQLRNTEIEQFRLNQLESLSNKLPEGIGSKLISGINPLTGEIIIPELASPETQLYAKIINDFTTSAKDSYGARVTDFDLQQFMKRLPMLSNTKEGRDLIFDYMKKVKEIDTRRNNALIDVYNKYKLDGISQEDAARAVDDMLADDRLIQEAQQINKKINAFSEQKKSEYSIGDIAVVDGVKYEFNGNKWIEVE